MPRMDAHDTDLSRLADDIGTLARLLGAPHDPAAVARTLTVFQFGFGRCPVELRTTTPKPGKAATELSFRYVDPHGSEDPYRICLDAGVLPAAGRPVDLLVPELQRRFRIFGYGVDASAGVGLEKIWPLFAEPRPLDEALLVTSLPASVSRSEPWLRRHGLTQVNIIAADYRHESTNLYFLNPPGALSPDAVGRMIADLGFPAPPPELLAYDAGSMITNVSYTWRSDAVERVCFYSVAKTAADVPVDDPVLRAAIAGARTLEPDGMYIVGNSHGAGGRYTKLEIDYTGTSVPLFQRWVEKQSRR